MNIKTTCETFLSTWDRSEWMQDNGTWASEKWDELREEVREELKSIDLEDVNLKDVLIDLADRLEGQVISGVGDYIEAGTIDPDYVARYAKNLEIEATWQEWDCKEGWMAYRYEDALYLRWYRDAWGSRIERDLWVLVDEEFFKCTNT